ncbi:MAG TPA: carboxypeptidase-like regulatory domain-containing protein [Chitinophagaceae bacterium]
MGVIKGVVRDQKDVPLEGLNIIIVSGPTHPDITAVTDNDGTFSFSDLRAGNYMIKAYGMTESDDVPVKVYRGKTTYVEIWMETGAVDDQGNVVDEV